MEKEDLIIEKLTGLEADVADMHTDMVTREDHNMLQKSVDRFMTLHEKLDHEFLHL